MCHPDVEGECPVGGIFQNFSDLSCHRLKEGLGQKKCFVVDLSLLSRFLRVLKFRMVTVDRVRMHLSPNTWLASLDLVNAYWHIPINIRLQFIAFQVDSITVQCKVLLFDFFLTPSIFTEIAMLLVAKLTQQGVDILMYLADWLVTGDSKLTTLQMVTTTVNTTASWGLHINMESPKLV